MYPARAAVTRSMDLPILPRGSSNRLDPVKIAHFGPPGLLADVLPACLEPARYHFIGTALGSGLRPKASDLLDADVVLLWVAPQPPSLSLLDDMHAILVLLREAKRSRPQRVILISNLLSWGACPLLGENFHAGDSMRASEDTYLDRRCWPSCEGLMALEAHVMRLEGPTLHACVIAAGVTYGAGEESFFKLVRDAYNFNLMVLPASGANVIPSVHVCVLCTFICFLLDSDSQFFPKPYLIACEPRSATLKEIAFAFVREWHRRAGRAAGDGGSTLLSGQVSEGNSRATNNVSQLEFCRRFKDPSEGCEVCFAYPASIVLALDCAGLQIAGGIFEQAIDTPGARPFTCGLVSSIVGVVDEFIEARGLTPRRIWVLRQPGRTQAQRAVAKFISEQFKFTLIDADNSLKWVLAQSQHSASSGSNSVNEDKAADTLLPQSSIDSEVWKLQEEIRALLPGHNADVCSAALPLRLVSRCIRVRLLDPVLVTHSYVLDACPASPLMLKYIFIPECEVDGSKNICLSPLLAPSHMVILTEPSVVPQNATPEQREWISLQASDWRFQGDSKMHTHLSMIPSLVDLFDDTVHPLAIPLADLALDVSNNWTSLDDLSPWWVSKNTSGCSNNLTLPNPSTPSWQREIIKLLDWVHPVPKAIAATDRHNRALNFFRVTKPGSKESCDIQEEAVSRQSCTFLAKHSPFNQIITDDNEKLLIHSSGLRHFLLSVMDHVAKGMLETMRPSGPKGKIESLGDVLARRAQHLEACACAYAYLRYRSSLGKLHEFRQCEDGDDSS